VGHAAGFSAAYGTAAHTNVYLSILHLAGGRSCARKVRERRAREYEQRCMRPGGRNLVYRSKYADRGRGGEGQIYPQRNQKTEEERGGSFPPAPGGPVGAGQGVRCWRRRARAAPDGSMTDRACARRNNHTGTVLPRATSSVDGWVSMALRSHVVEAAGVTVRY
jgi:hypothetical protein